MNMQAAKWQSPNRADSTWAREVGTPVSIVSFSLDNSKKAKTKMVETYSNLVIYYNINHRFIVESFCRYFNNSRLYFVWTEILPEITFKAQSQRTFFLRCSQLLVSDIILRPSRTSMESSLAIFLTILRSCLLLALSLSSNVRMVTIWMKLFLWNSVNFTAQLICKCL